MPGEVWAQSDIPRLYCCNGDPKCSSARTCTTNGNVLTISAGMGYFDRDCNYSSVDTKSTGLNVLEARLIEYDAAGKIIPNPVTGENGTWILENDLQYCTPSRPEHLGVNCTSTGFNCQSNFSTRTVECTLDLSKAICWRQKDYQDGDEDMCYGPWQKNPKTRRIEVNLVYDDLSRQMCCESTYCYFCSCVLSAAPTATPTPTRTPTPSLSLPNCYNLTGPSKLCTGVEGYYEADFYSPEGNLRGRIGEGDYRIFADQTSGGNSLRVGGSWSSSIPGNYLLTCRAWNDAIAECRYVDHVTVPPVYTCKGPTNYMWVNVSDCATPTATPTKKPTPTPTPDTSTGYVNFRVSPWGMINHPELQIQYGYINSASTAQDLMKKTTLVYDEDYLGQLSMLPGTYRIQLRLPRHLPVVFDGVSVGKGENSEDWRNKVILGGNVLADNVIDIFDLAMVVENLDATGEPTALQADVDYDGRVTIFDLAQVVENLDARGEEL